MARVRQKAGLWACLCRLRNINVDSAESKEIAGIPLSSMCDENPPSACLLGQLG